MSIDIENLGNPNRDTKGSPDRGDSDEESEESTSRKRRISVTPRDPEKLEKVANKLNLPMSKVYNMGFQTLLEKLDFE